MIRTRRGVSLIELLVIMTACTVVLTLTGELVCRMMRIQIQSRGRFDVERSALRLSEKFRRDVHLATAAVTRTSDPSDEIFLQLQFANGRQADYSRQAGTVLRAVSGGANGQVWREEFDFPAACELSLREDGAPRRLILTISTGANEAVSGNSQSLVAAPTVPVSFQVEARLGRDLRFADEPARQEATE